MPRELGKHCGPYSTWHCVLPVFRHAGLAYQGDTKGMHRVDGGLLADAAHSGVLRVRLAAGGVS